MVALHYPADVARLMNDAIDDDCLAIDAIQDCVGTMRQGAHSCAQFGSIPTSERLLTKQAEQPTKPFDIACRRDRAVLRRSDITDLFEIATRHRADAEISHAVGGYRR
jgi:hypothetical protein